MEVVPLYVSMCLLCFPGVFFFLTISWNKLQTQTCERWLNLSGKKKVICWRPCNTASGARLSWREHVHNLLSFVSQPSFWSTVKNKSVWSDGSSSSSYNVSSVFCGITCADAPASSTEEHRVSLIISPSRKRLLSSLLDWSFYSSSRVARCTLHLQFRFDPLN